MYKKHQVEQKSGTSQNSDSVFDRFLGLRKIDDKKLVSAGLHALDLKGYFGASDHRLVD
jgi:hypothetical protein